MQRANFMKKIILKYVEKQLAKWAKRVLAKNPNLEIIGITGSVGKSSTKEAIYQVLGKSKRFEGAVAKSEGNLNTEIGLPLAILGFKKNPNKFTWLFVFIVAFFRAIFLNPLTQISILILEYAADKRGDIKYLISIAKPNMAIVTRIGRAHTIEFGDLEGVAREKAQLAAAVGSTGAIFLNKDDKFSHKISRMSVAKIIYFSDHGIDTAKEIARSLGKYFGLSEKEINLGIKNIKPLAHRLNIISGANHITIIDDTYNANPESTKAALDFLHNFKDQGRKIAVLGDMLELGSLEKEAHTEIAAIAIKTADLFIGVGLKFQPNCPDNWFLDPFLLS